MIELTPEQQKAYDRFIAARNRVGLGRVKPSAKYSWVPMRDYIATVDVVGLNHPLFEINEPWMEYKEAFLAWLAIEPAFRHEERMRMSRGDYGNQDSWDEKGNGVSDIVKKIKDKK
jgi:hypothetical protein